MTYTFVNIQLKLTCIGGTTPLIRNQRITFEEKKPKCDVFNIRHSSNIVYTLVSDLRSRKKTKMSVGMRPMTGFGTGVQRVLQSRIDLVELYIIQQFCTTNLQRDKKLLHILEFSFIKYFKNIGKISRGQNLPGCLNCLVETRLNTPSTPLVA